MQNVFFRAGLLHHFAGKGDWTGGCQGDAAAFETSACCSRDIVELAGATADVVSGMAGSNVYVARAAAQCRSAGCSRFTCSSIVGDRLTMKHKVFVFDFDISM